MPKRRHVEAAIQREFVRWVRDDFVLLLGDDITDFTIVAVRNEASTSAMSLALDKKMGLTPGFPDLIITFIKDEVKHIYYLELKTMKGTLSKSQKEWHSKFIETGNSKLAVAKGLDAAKARMIGWFNQNNHAQELLGQV